MEVEVEQDGVPQPEGKIAPLGLSELEVHQISNFALNLNQENSDLSTTSAITREETQVCRPSCEPIEMAPTPDRGGAKKLKGKGRAKKSEFDVWNEADALLGNAKSILFKDETDIAKFMKDPLAQGFLASTSTNTAFTSLDHIDQKRTITFFKNDGQLGWYDTDYLTEALDASRARARGDYEEYLEQKFLQEWDPEALEEHNHDEVKGEKKGGTTAKSTRKAAEQIAESDARARNVNADAKRPKKRIIHDSEDSEVENLDTLRASSGADANGGVAVTDEDLAGTTAKKRRLEEADEGDFADELA